MKILVIDRDPTVHDLLDVILGLQFEGYVHIDAATGSEGLRALDARHPDAVILEMDPLARDGFETLDAIRSRSRVPVIAIATRADDATHIRALEHGAEIFLAKPVDPLVLVAHLRAILRRLRPEQRVDEQPDIVCGPLRMHPNQHSVTVGGEPIRLTPVGFRLLALLASSAGQVVPREALLTAAWGRDALATPAQLKVEISRLRARLSRHAGAPGIAAERGVGYRLTAPRRGDGGILGVTVPHPAGARLGADADA